VARPGYRFGDVVFRPTRMSGGAREACYAAKREFNSARASPCGPGPQGQRPHARAAGLLLAANLVNRREILRKQGGPGLPAPEACAGGSLSHEGPAVRLTLVNPNIGRREHSLYVDEGRMEPLQLGSWPP